MTEKKNCLNFPEEEGSMIVEGKSGAGKSGLAEVLKRVAGVELFKLDCARTNAAASTETSNNQ